MKRQLVLGIFAALILSAAPAFASDTNREDRGGSKIGPLGQCFDPRACYGGYYGGGYYGSYPGGGYYAYGSAYGSVLPPRYYEYPGYNPDLDYY